MRHTLIDPAAAYISTGLLQKLFSLLAVLLPLSTDLLASVSEEFNSIYTSLFKLWLMMFLCTCRWGFLHVHSGWSNFCCAPGCRRKEHTPWAMLQMSCRSLNHCQWLFPAPPFLVSQGPVAVTSRICITPVMGRRVTALGKASYSLPE